MKRAELQIAHVSGAQEEDRIFRVKITDVSSSRRVIAQFELHGGDLMLALTGRVTRVELKEAHDR